jgi:hypothetical protein
MFVSCHEMPWGLETGNAVQPESGETAGVPGA